jgi:hypothetical protein
MSGDSLLVVPHGPYDSVACSLVCGVVAGWTGHYIISHMKLEPVSSPGWGLRREYKGRHDTVVAGHPQFKTNPKLPTYSN